MADERDWVTSTEVTNNAGSDAGHFHLTASEVQGVYVLSGRLPSIVPPSQKLLGGWIPRNSPRLIVVGTNSMPCGAASSHGLFLGAPVGRRSEADAYRSRPGQASANRADSTKCGPLSVTPTGLPEGLEVLAPIACRRPPSSVGGSNRSVRINVDSAGFHLSYQQHFPCSRLVKRNIDDSIHVGWNFKPLCDECTRLSPPQ